LIVKKLFFSIAEPFVCLFFFADAIVCLFFSFVAAYCCENHVGFNFEIISECIRSLDEFIDYLELNRVED
jgi:hypothetical protein